MHAVSYLAPSMFDLYRAVCDALGRAVNRPVTLVQADADPLEDPALRAGQVDFAFICGLPFVRLKRGGAMLDALAAPVTNDSRNGGRPLYFADFIAASSSRSHTLDEAHGQTFAFNDPGSNSGVHLPRHHLMSAGFESGYFGRAVMTGAHHNSIQWVADGRADCAAIDSTVLDAALRRDPALAGKIRVIGSSAPCPVPPLVMHRRYTHLRQFLQAALADPDGALREALSDAGIRRLAAVDDKFYSVVGLMFDRVNAAEYQLAAPA